jgi:hypothetical protein
MAYTVYFDVSGSPDQGVAVVVGGFIALDTQWAEFDRNWTDTLKIFGVSMLHMKDFAHSVGEFKTWKGDTAKRTRFLQCLISHLKLRARHSFVSTVMMDHYHEIDSKHILREAFTPLALAGCTCIAKVKKWASRWGIDENEIALVFEDGDKDKGDLIKRVNQYHHRNPEFKTKEQCVAFQAADLLAYEHLKANRKIFECGTGVLGIEALRRSLQALRAIPHGDEGADWGIHDLESLERCVDLGLLPDRIIPDFVDK